VVGVAPRSQEFARSTGGTKLAVRVGMGGSTAVAIAAALWVGLLLGARAGTFAAWAGALAAIPLAWLAWRGPSRVGTVALALAVLCAAVARGAATRAALEAGSHSLAHQGEPAWISARVVDHPWRDGEEPLALVVVTRAESRIPAGTRVRLRLPPGTRAEWGDTLRMLARVEPLSRRRTPGGYDARDAGWAQGIVAQGRALVVQGSFSGHAVRATFARWRRAIDARLASQLSTPAREIVIPLVTGDRSGLGPELATQLRASGLTHLIALSGLHVAWMAAVARAGVAAAGGGLAARALAGALCAFLYVGLAGGLPSLARAAATEIVAAVASLRGRALEPLQALALSAAGLLAIAPGWADDLGFQLSCAATLGLVTLGRVVSTALAGRSRALSWLVAPLVPTAAAQIAALPIVLERFHALPWTGLGANLLAVPVCELLLASAWMGVLIDLALPGAGRWFLAACEWLAAALRAIAGGAAAAPLALIPTGRSPGPVLLAAVGVVLVAFAAAGPRDLARARFGPTPGRVASAGLGTFALMLAVLLATTAPTMRPPLGRWWLVVLDVGQGDAIAIGTAAGWWLVDTGPRSRVHDAGASAVLPFLRWAAVRRLDGLILTHDHGDHTGGAGAVRRELPITRVVIPAGAPWLRAGFAFAETRVAGDTLAHAPLMIVKWPRADFRSTDPNAASLVLELGEAAGRSLLAADVDSVIESRLDVSTPLAALKVAHHGASSSSGTAFLERVRPRFAVVSCGRNNPFGHPDEGALTRLERSGAQVRRTDLDATVWFEVGVDGARELPWRSWRESVAAAAPARGVRGSLAHAPARW
jgi:competence protein ComEC